MGRKDWRLLAASFAASPPVVSLLRRITAALTDALGDNLVGVYLHGSLALGCFRWERSDVDLLVVVDDPVPVAAKRRLVAALLSLNKAAPPKGLELSVVSEGSLAAFTHPLPYELHFSPAWRDRYAAGEVDLVVPRTDPDLAAHWLVLRARGICLAGAPIAMVIPAVPRRAVLESLAADLTPTLPEPAVTADLVLNFCRTAAFLADDAVRSKVEGGEWAVTHLAAAYQPLILAALQANRDGTELLPPEPSLLAALSREVLATLTQAQGIVRCGPWTR